MLKPEPSEGPLWRRLHTPKQWAAVGVLSFAAIVVVPLLNSSVPPSSAFHLSDYQVTLFGKYRSSVAYFGVPAGGGVCSPSRTL